MRLQGMCQCKNYFSYRRATITFADEDFLSMPQALDPSGATRSQGFALPQASSYSKQAADPGIIAGAVSKEHG